MIPFYFPTGVYLLSGIYSLKNTDMYEVIRTFAKQGADDETVRGESADINLRISSLKAAGYHEVLDRNEVPTQPAPLTPEEEALLVKEGSPTTEEVVALEDDELVV